MDSVYSLLSELRQYGIRVSLDNEKIRLWGQNKDIPEWLINKVRDNREELKSFLTESNKKEESVPSKIINPDDKYEVDTTFYQQREWILYKIKEDKNFFNTQSFFEIHKFDKGFLDKIIRHIAQRHINLRTTFKLVNGALKQVIHPMNSFVAPIEIIDLTNEKDDSRLKQFIEAENIKPFDFENDFLYRIKCFLLNNQKVLVLLTAHHVIVDNASMKILQNEIQKLYLHFAENQPLNLPIISKQTFDFSKLQNDLAQSSGIFHKYWHSKLIDGFPQQNLVSEVNQLKNNSHRREIYEIIREKISVLGIAKPPSVYTLISRYEAHKGGELKGIFSEEAYLKLNQLSAQLKISNYNILKSFFALTIFQLTKQNNFFIELPQRCQTQGYENTLGWLILSGFLKFEIDENLSIEQFIIQTTQNFLELTDSCIYPAESLFDTYLATEQCLPTLLSYVENNCPIEPNRILGSQESRDDGLIAYSDIFCTFGKYDDALEYVVYYSRNLYEPHQIKELFDCILKNIILSQDILQCTIASQSQEIFS